MYLVDLQRFWCSPVSNTDCAWLWTTCLELSVLHIMWLSAGIGCVQKEPSCVPMLAFTSTRPKGGSIKASELLEIHCAWRLFVRLKEWKSSSCTPQQQGLSTIRWGRIISVGGAIASPQADVFWRRVLCLRKMASTEWGMTQHRDPGICSFSSVPWAISPRLSWCIASPLCPLSARAQGRWLQTKLHVFLAL